MSFSYLVEINCDLKPDASQEFLAWAKEAAEASNESRKPLSDFPGWSVFRLALVEKHENYSRYTLSIRIQMHDDIFALWDFQSYLDRIAANSQTQGFVGIFRSSITNDLPKLIIFEKDKSYLLEITTIRE